MIKLPILKVLLIVLLASVVLNVITMYAISGMKKNNNRISELIDDIHDRPVATIAKDSTSVMTAKALNMTAREVKQNRADLLRRLDNIELRLNKKISDLTLVTSSLDHSFTASGSVYYDTVPMVAYEYSDPPWVSYKAEQVDSFTQSVQLHISDSLLIAGYREREGKFWPTKWLTPWEYFITANSANPYVTLKYTERINIDTR